MTQEEKAKAYDEAIERANELNYVSDKDSLQHKTVEYIFPELKESKDEGIREWLIGYFNQYIIDGMPLVFGNGLNVKDVITWLEKQGDKDKLIRELGEYKVKYTREVLERYINSMSNKDDEKLKKTTIAFLKDFADKGYENAVECIDWLEKQSEKTEPIEDFDTEFEKQTSHLIANIINKDYEYTKAFVKWTSESLLNYAKLGIEKQGNNNMGISEATKKKLEDNLNKALERETPESWNEFLDEQKPAELGENRSKELSLSLQIQAYLNTASDELYAKGKPLYSEERIEDIHKCMLMWQKLHNAYFYQKPTWSEEDEAKLKSILFHIEDVENKDVINWFKSLKDRVQPQQQKRNREDEK